MMLPPSMRFFWFLVLLRLAWTCLPQMGYVHPDEFFQSVEVASGLLTTPLPMFPSQPVDTRARLLCSEDLDGWWHRVVVTYCVPSRLQRSYATPGPVSTWMTVCGR